MATNDNEASVNYVDLQESILKAIDAVVTQRNNELKLDKTITGVVKKNLGMQFGKPFYQVEYNGGFLKATAQNTEDSYVPNTSVYVLVPEGNFSNEKIIIGRASSLTTDRSASVVAAAINKYSIVGSNLLQFTGSNLFGLRSFHDKNTESDNHSYEHRAQFIYRYENEDTNDANKVVFKKDIFDIYKEDTSAIMIKADFKTNLKYTQKNVAGARYGLIFNFAFDNLNKGYGETNGEVLASIGEDVLSTIQQLSNDNNNEIWQYKTVSLKSLTTTFRNTLFQENPSSYKNLLDSLNLTDTGAIDQLVNDITLLYKNFKTESAALDKEIFNVSINAYLNLLNDLKNIISNNYNNNDESTAQNVVEQLKTEYQRWEQEIIGDSDQKIEQFVLTSDDMIGNPFGFETWSTQYSIFQIDLETFNHLDSVIFYKEGFKEDSNEESNWPIGVPGGGEDIFVKNIQIYAMNPLDAQSGDYTLKVQPVDGYDIILQADTDTTRLKATFLRKFYEDLTKNANVSYYWFKENSLIFSKDNSKYNALAGIGWEQLDPNKLSYIFETSGEQNPAYKNNYKCIAVYSPSTDDRTVLSYNFSIYNESKNTDLKLESDIGTIFSFDSGVPTIKALINENRKANPDTYEEIGYAADTPDANRDYKYTWAVCDSTNNQMVFLNEVLTSSANESLTLSAKENLVNKIKLYTYYDNKVVELTGNNKKSEKATRLKYPVAINSSGFTIWCFLQKRRENSEGDFDWYDAGSASLEFINQKAGTNVYDYQIQIENGNQVFKYDERGNAPNSNKVKDPIEILPLKAKLFNAAGIEIDGSGSNYVVEWIFPIENSLLTTTETLVNNPITGLQQSCKKNEFTFNIQDTYDYDCYDNQIMCHISFGEKNLYKETNFFIGKQGDNGTNGTDVVAKIDVDYSTFNVNAQAQKAAKLTLLDQPLTLYVNPAKNGRLNISANPSFASSVSLPLKLRVYEKNKDIAANTTYPVKWSCAGSMLHTKYAKFFTAKQDGSFEWTYTPDYTLDENNKKVPTGKYYRIQNLKAEINIPDTTLPITTDPTATSTKNRVYYAYFSLPIIEYSKSVPSNLSKIIAIDKKMYLKEVLYNSDGRDPIYNHNQGLKLINIPKNITKIVFSCKGGFHYTYNPRLISYDGINATTGTTYTENQKKAWSGNASKNYLITVKDSTERKSTITFSKANSSWDNSKEAMVYFLPPDFYDGDATNIRIEAELYQEGANGDELVATVYAPINMTLNTYGLASLNGWDGNSITMNEEEGAILAPQVGAGYKDSTNKFTGILMGTVKNYTNSKNPSENLDRASQTGLLGFHEGQQSIFLDATTGNAYFGKPNTITGQDTTNYNEGRIELIPGGVSKIGGWRIGRQSLYYATDKNGNFVIDPPNSQDWIPSGIGSALALGGAYCDHHKKDITGTHAGILLQAGENPYISIKGAPVSRSDTQDTDALSHLRDGDSLEVQLDPHTPTLFTIFRHNGKKWKKSSGYEEGTRTYLAGINSRGQLIANGLQSTTSTSEGDSTTTFGTSGLPAFGNNAANIGFIGLLLEASGQMVTKIFVANKNHSEGGKVVETKSSDSPLHITGSNDTENEYVRPIHLHGKNIALYASSGSILTTTPSYLKIDPATSNITLQMNSENTSLNLTDKTGTSSYLHTLGPLEIKAGTDKTAKNMTFKAAAYNINGTSSTTTLTNYTETIDSAGNISISAQGNEVHKLTGSDYWINIKNNSDTARDFTKNHLRLVESDSNHHYSASLGWANESGQRTNYIKISEEGDTTTYQQLEIKVGNSIQRPDEKSTDCIRIICPGVGSAGHYNSSSPQIALEAGSLSGGGSTKYNKTYLHLNSSDTSWSNTQNTSHYGDSKTYYAFKLAEAWSGAGIAGFTTIENDTFKPNIHIIGRTSITNGTLTLETANSYTFEGQNADKGKAKNNFNGSNLRPQVGSTGEVEPEYKTDGDNKGYYLIPKDTNVTNLVEAINYCLRAAGDAREKADAAQTKADDAYTHATTVASKLNAHTHTVKVTGTVGATATITKAEVVAAAAAKIKKLNAQEVKYSVGDSSSYTRSDTQLINDESYNSGNVDYALRNAYPEAEIDTKATVGISKDVSADYENTVTTDQKTFVDITNW